MSCGGCSNKKPIIVNRGIQKPKLIQQLPKSNKINDIDKHRIQ